MFCKFCGAPVPDGAKFCPKCGQSLDTATKTAPTPQPEPQPEDEVAPEIEEEEAPQKPYMSMKELFSGAKITAKPEVHFMSKKHLILLVVILVVIIIAALIK
jgi:predicted amidophosphoribosyltransferase